MKKSGFRVALFFFLFAKLVLRYSSAPKLDLVNFWEQVVFSWINGNADMHLKNFSLYNPQQGFPLSITLLSLLQSTF